MKSKIGHCPCRKEAALVKPFSLPSNISWIAVGNSVDAIAQWARIVVLLHLGGEVMVGALALAMAVCAPVYALAGLGLRGAAVTDARHEYQFGDYLALRLVTSVVAMLAVAMIVFATGCEPHTALLVMLVGLGELLKAISDVFHALQQQNERMDRFAISLMIRGPLMVAALTLGVWWTGSLLYGVAGLPLVAAAVLILYDVPSARRLVRALHASGIAPRWRLPTMLRLAWLSCPLGVVIMMIALQTSVPRYLISSYFGNYELGVFAAIFCLGTVGAKAAGAICQSAGPRLAKYYAADNISAYSKLLGKLVAAAAVLGAAAVLVMMLFGGPILALIYKAQFARYAELAVYLTAAAAVGYLTHPLGIAIEAMRRFKIHMAVRAIGVAVLLAAAPVLIANYGLKGVAVAITLSNVSIVLGCAGVVFRSLSTTKGIRDWGLGIGEKAQHQILIPNP